MGRSYLPLLTVVLLSSLPGCVDGEAEPGAAYAPGAHGADAGGSLDADTHGPDLDSNQTTEDAAALDATVDSEAPDLSDHTIADATDATILDGGLHAMDTGSPPDPADVASGPDEGPVAAPWVRILSPRDGDVVLNPVPFEFEAGDGVVTVAFEADEWPLQDAPLSADARHHSYTFSGVGRERRVLLRGFDGHGAEVAVDEVRFTPMNPEPELVFPIGLRDDLFLSNFDSNGSTAAFRSGRSGGRLHAGCDLYWTNDDGNAYADRYHELNDNLPVYAVADGTITAYYAFYLGTHALEVNHGDFVVRYGEVSSGGLHGGLGVGSEVAAGQQIAIMGDLDIGSGWSMLHFELYSGERNGSLTQGNGGYLHVPDGNYQRRADLLDCTPFLVDLLDEAGG